MRLKCRNERWRYKLEYNTFVVRAKETSLALFVMLGNSVKRKNYVLFRQEKAIPKIVLMMVYIHFMFVHR